MNGTFNPVFGCELALLDCSFHEQVVALFICGCDVGQVVVEDQAVPIRLRDELVLFVTIIMILRQPGVRDLVPEGKNRRSGFAERFPAISILFFCIYDLSSFDLSFFEETGL